MIILGGFFLIYIGLISFIIFNTSMFERIDSRITDIEKKLKIDDESY